MKITILILLFLCGCALKEKTPEEVAKISVANLNGQKTLYKEGWLLIPSAEKSLSYSYDNSILTAKESFERWKQNNSSDTKKYFSKLSNIPTATTNVYKAVDKTGKNLGKKISQKTKEMTNFEMDAAKRNFSKAFEGILLGSVHIGEFTQKDRQQIKRKIFGLGKDIKSDLKTMKEVTSFLKTKNEEKVSQTWKHATDRAAKEWGKEYKKSAEQPNSLMALPYVVWGNLKALWFGLVSPSAEYTFEGGKFVANQGLRIVKKGVLLPVGGTLVISGRTVWNTGGALFYTTRMGVKVVSKYLEAGLLTSMGILSTGSVVPTYVTGESLGFFSQIGMKGAGLAGASTYALGNSAIQTGHLCANYLYNTIEGTGKVVFGGTKTAVVLGYNALTALPAQVLLSAINSVWFLAWDGPRLALYSIKGKLKGSTVEDLPVGSVLDIEKAKAKGLKLEEVKVDDQTLQEVLKQLPKDLRK